MHQRTLLIKSAIITLFVAAAVTAAVLGLRPEYVGTRAGKADENYIPSQDCKVCHEDHFASWSRTHHSRMTQDIKPESVQGDFEKNTIFEYTGVTARMVRSGDKFWMNFKYPDGRIENNEIYRTVGSRRVEQYVTRRNGQYVRLPIAYDIERKRWMSLNGSFFFPDGDNFNQHVAQWDTNCVFCHNVKAQPNFNFNTRMAATEVAELGIACGACHGQGAEHAEMASSPLTRARWHLNDKAETGIVNPLKLDSDRAMMICGHCHGQRVPEPMDRIREIMTKGDPFDAGEDLSEFYHPVGPDTKIGNVSFENRFWPDGSPRLTAYEYQGVTGSKCFTEGEPGNRISCMSCHSMHDGDVKGQITAEKRTSVACTQCHTELAAEPALSQHTKHPADSKGSSCYSCHMPEVVSGIMAFHKTHKITIPEPRLTLENSVPNACNQCHVDKSLNWTFDQAKALWPDHYGSLERSADKQFDQPESVRGLFAGDALTRAMMADAMRKHGEASWYTPLLAEAFAGDNYPIVRFFAANGLSFNQPTPDYLANVEMRESQLALFIRQLDPGKMSDTRATAEALRKIRRDVDLEVGE
ncbi:MAG: cytochrome c3 family protein [Pyrinomonadaceae bacterium]